MAFSAPALAFASRRGKELIVPRSGSLPATCIKCGASADKPWRKKFYWHTPWLYLMIIFPGLLIYVIVALIVRKKMELNLPLCERHHGDRKRYRLLGAVMLAGFVPAGLFLGKIGSETLGWVTGCAMFAAAIVFYALCGLGVRPTKIDENGGIFRGAGPVFLDALPEQR
jgi:hypothetical protein